MRPTLAAASPHYRIPAAFSQGGGAGISRPERLSEKSLTLSERVSLEHRIGLSHTRL